MNPDRCKEKVLSGGFRYRGCSNKATRDGFCSIHHPDMVAKRNAEREERWAAKDAAWRRRSENLAETYRRANAYPELVQALRAFLTAGQYTSANAEKAAEVLRNLKELP